MEFVLDDNLLIELLPDERSSASSGFDCSLAGLAHDGSSCLMALFDDRIRLRKNGGDGGRPDGSFPLVSSWEREGFGDTILFCFLRRDGCDEAKPEVHFGCGHEEAKPLLDDTKFGSWLFEALPLELEDSVR